MNIAIDCDYQSFRICFPIQKHVLSSYKIPWFYSMISESHSGCVQDYKTWCGIRAVGCNFQNSDYVVMDDFLETITIVYKYRYRL